jgi:anthranilate phosphoribosyltransferase
VEQEMPFDFKKTIANLADGHILSREEARNAFNYMMNGDATGPQIGAFLMALRVRGEHLDEITGAVEAMRSKASTIKALDGAIDTCGTGGDTAGTYNISTAAAIVLAVYRLQSTVIVLYPVNPAVQMSWKDLVSTSMRICSLLKNVLMNSV